MLKINNDGDFTKMTFTTCPELEILLREITNEIIDS